MTHKLTLNVHLWKTGTKKFLKNELQQYKIKQQWTISATYICGKTLTGPSANWC